MGQVFKRSDWNSIIQAVNNLSTNPPVGTDPLSPLDQVPAGHKWSASDIQAVRSKLQAICGDNSFSAPLVKWSQASIDEIRSAIARGWCGTWIDHPEDICITIAEPVPYDLTVYLGPAYNCTPEEDAGCQAGCDSGERPVTYTSLASLVNGLQVAAPGIGGRYWGWVWSWTWNGVTTTSQFNEGGGHVNCDGTIHEAPNLLIPSTYVRRVYHRYCRDHVCQSGGYVQNEPDSKKLLIRVRSRGGPPCQ